MPVRMPRLPWLAPLLAYFLYFFGITAAGLIGPDEPRYAAIGREMARSGDWITPRLWGAPWFEKPALLYWMTASAFHAGLGPDLAPRLPVVVLSVAFLALFWWMLWREFGCFVAWMASLILASSAGWCLYSETGVTDIPLSATFAAAMLFAIPWISKRDARFLPLSGALLGLAVLAKGPVGLILAAPLAVRWRDLWDWFRPRVAGPFLIIGAPWYILCYLRNGVDFLNEFFWKHNVGRFTSPELQHEQHWWFYAPALLVLFLPWSPILPFAARPAAPGDLRRRFLLLLALWPLIFFSLSVNKLPGYILPAFPAVAALAALGLAEASRARVLLASAALATVAFVIAAPLVDIASISRGGRIAFDPTWIIPIPVAGAVWLLDSRGKRLAAVAVIACLSTAGIAYLKIEVGRRAFAREVWRAILPVAGQTCVERLERSWRYGLNYYSVSPLPDCSASERPLALSQTENAFPAIGKNLHATVDQR